MNFISNTELIAARQHTTFNNVTVVGWDANFLVCHPFKVLVLIRKSQQSMYSMMCGQLRILRP